MASCHLCSFNQSLSVPYLVKLQSVIKNKNLQLNKFRLQCWAQTLSYKGFLLHNLPVVRTVWKLPTFLISPLWTWLFKVLAIQSTISIMVHTLYHALCSWTNIFYICSSTKVLVLGDSGIYHLRKEPRKNCSPWLLSNPLSASWTPNHLHLELCSRAKIVELINKFQHIISHLNSHLDALYLDLNDDIWILRFSPWCWSY